MKPSDSYDAKTANSGDNDELVPFERVLEELSWSRNHP